MHFCCYSPHQCDAVCWWHQGTNTVPVPEWRLSSHRWPTSLPWAALGSLCSCCTGEHSLSGRPCWRDRKLLLQSRGWNQRNTPEVRPGPSLHPNKTPTTSEPCTPAGRHGTLDYPGVLKCHLLCNRTTPGIHRYPLGNPNLKPSKKIQI